MNGRIKAVTVEVARGKSAPLAEKASKKWRIEETESNSKLDHRRANK